MVVELVVKVLLGAGGGVVLMEAPFGGCRSGTPGGDYARRVIGDGGGAPGADAADMGLTSCRWVAID
ncbi:hypothetical protein GCM10009721_42380 [Terrabacter tumescens]|uniref:Uncharacterized protein n=1 Tax=Terrabacter tumescens TaxID=60443 RepID=A0ABQ2IFV9_9MICO|nr:hypothetical protein GCM10009721_42380 [Terrabacter tumescens]